MISFNTITGKWKGTYILGPEYESREGESYEFILDLIDENQSFKGESYEDGLSERFPDPITVEGFWDDDMISFTKHYPCLYSIGDDGQITIDISSEHPGIVYSGEFNADNNEFSGNFEMIVDSIRDEEGWLDYSLTGTWSMKRFEE